MKFFRYCSEYEISKILHGNTLISEFDGAAATTSKGFCFADNRLLGNFEIFNYAEFPAQRPLFIFEVEDPSIFTKSYGRYTERFVSDDVESISKELKILSEDEKQISLFKELFDKDITIYSDRKEIAQTILECELEDDSFLMKDFAFLDGGWKEEFCIPSYNQEIIKPIKIVLEDDRIIDLNTLLSNENLKTNDREIAKLIACIYPEKLNELNDEFKNNKQFLLDVFAINDEILEYINPSISKNESFKEDLIQAINKNKDNRERRISHQYNSTIFKYFEFYDLRKDKNEALSFILNIENISNKDELLNQLLENIGKENIDDDFIYKILENNLDDIFNKEYSHALSVYANFFNFEEVPIIKEKLNDESFIQKFLEISKHKESILLIPTEMINSTYKESLVNEVYSYYLNHKDILENYKIERLERFLKNSLDDNIRKVDFVRLYEDGVINFETILNNNFDINENNPFIFGNKKVAFDEKIFKQMQKERILEAFDLSKIKIEDIDEDLLNDKSFMLSLIKLDTSSILKAKDEFKKDKEFLLDAIRTYPYVVSYIKSVNSEAMEDNSFLIKACKILKEVSKNERDFRINLDDLDFIEKIRTNEEFFIRFCQEVDFELGMNIASYKTFEYGYPQTSEIILEKIKEFSKEEELILENIKESSNVAEIIRIIDESLINNEFLSKVVDNVEDFSSLKFFSHLTIERSDKKEEIKEFIGILKEGMKSVLIEKYDFDFSDKKPKMMELYSIYEGTVLKEEQMSLLKESLHKELEKQNKHELIV